MDLLQLKYFVLVAHLEHMTRAAEELHVSQPALSKTISSFEKELGVLLFDRRGKYIHLNQYGTVFLARVEQALSLLADGKNELRDLSGTASGDDSLAFLAASNLLPELLTSFRQKYPGISFHLIQHIAGMVTKPDYDLCIYSSVLNPAGFLSTPLLTEEILLAVPTEHPLAKRTSICLNEVMGDSFISLRPGHNLRETTDALCKYAGFTPRIAFESDDPATVRGLIKAGLGIAFIPAITWGNTTGSSIVLYTLKILSAIEPSPFPINPNTIYLMQLNYSLLTSPSFLKPFFLVSLNCCYKNKTSKHPRNGMSVGLILYLLQFCRTILQFHFIV